MFISVIFDTKTEESTLMMTNTHRNDSNRRFPLISQAYIELLPVTNGNYKHQIVATIIYITSGCEVEK